MYEQKDLLVEEDVVLTPARPGLRFANYVIDIIAFYVLLAIVTFASAFFNIGNIGFIYLLTFAILIGYYTIMEGATNGKTLGKYVTKTRAVKEDGTVLTFKEAFVRTLCRLVPFEPLSAFSSYPWHDKWTRTMVVKEQ